MRTMVIYTSKTGKTRAVAEHIAESSGSDIANLGSTPSPDISGYDRVVFGSGVYAGRVSKRMRAFIDSADTEGKDVRMFVTCMYRGDKGGAQAETISGTLGFPVVSFSGRDRVVPSTAVEEFVAELSR